MRYLFSLLLLIMLFTGCSKNKVSNDSYIGTWEARSSAGMLGLRTFEPGNGNLLRFTEDSLYSYAAGALVGVTKYKLVKGTLEGFGDTREADKLVLDNFTTGESYSFLEFKGDTLVNYVGLPALDGGSTSYVRIN